MYEQVKLREYTEDLKEGINEYDITRYVASVTHVYKHENINDLIIQPNDTFNTIEVVSKELIRFLYSWNKLTNISGQLRITIPCYPDKTKVEIINQSYITHYKCNSRQIFKPYRALEKLVIATRKLQKRNVDYKANSTGSLSDNVLMVALFLNNNLAALKMLERFSTNQIIKRLNANYFKHLYKLIHPDTKYIDTKT